MKLNIKFPNAAGLGCGVGSQVHGLMGLAGGKTRQVSWSRHRDHAERRLYEDLQVVHAGFAEESCVSQHS